jgi:hypothetical protein
MLNLLVLTDLLNFRPPESAYVNTGSTGGQMLKENQKQVQHLQDTPAAQTMQAASI